MPHTLTSHHPSTISLELKRNSGRRGGYNWETAQKNVFYHKHRCHGNRSVGQDVKEKAIRLLKEEQWSPEQISGSLAKKGLSISHETIYAIIRKDKWQGGDTLQELPSTAQAQGKTCQRKAFLNTQSGKH